MKLKLEMNKILTKKIYLTQKKILERKNNNSMKFYNNKNMTLILKLSKLKVQKNTYKKQRIH